MLEVGELRIDQEPGRDREGRPLGRLRQCADAERAADTHLAIEDMGREIGEAGQLARAAGEDHAPARVGG